MNAEKLTESITIELTEHRMLIEGPLKIAVAEPADGQRKLLIVEFQPDFQALDLAEQGRAFKSYIEDLNDQIGKITDANDPNRAGMLIMEQFAEQLLPHVEAGELALEESMTVQIRRDDQVAALQDLLSTVKPG
ncbi:MAG: transcriptional regulator [Gammaproteobacteria bacterium]|nr:transcriptional regulator [Gammaproteobacteria bacterium]